MTLIDASSAPVVIAYDDVASLDDAAAVDLFPAEHLGAAFSPVQDRIRDWLRRWDAVALPAFEPVRDIHPDDERRSSMQTVPGRADGAARVTASFYDPPTRQGEARVWSRNWLSAVVLPKATEAGRLHFRFGVGSRLVLDGQSETGLVSTSVHLGVVADAASASPLDAPGFHTPIARPLVAVPFREDADADASQTFEGSIDLQAGDAPAFAFVLGTDVVFREGWARIHEGSSTWVGPAGAGPTGAFEVRFTPADLLARFGD
ncbi:hypothetical protein ET445_16200 [Agromyces protaetiae]|uniref:Uncharacterized protein n=1 Tax=Agromyces protaetiae TaxID=2509455 RepID=A0A4V0YHG6_9MICO|nr:hypothetical protein [Agromyces protaetiae]QAY74641.1 hypothetical protein ET445_16200 [Agromyces protaetiae]